MPTYDGKIRSLVVGTDPKNAFRFDLDQKLHAGPVGQVTISLIQFDDNNYYNFGQAAYRIYVKKTPEGEDLLWKSFIGHTVMVEYAI